MSRPEAPVKVRRGARWWTAECRYCPSWSATGLFPFVLRTAISHTNPTSSTTCQGGTR